MEISESNEIKSIQEKREIYKKSKSEGDKEKRENLKKAKKEGTLSERRLYFFEVIKDKMGYNNNSLSVITGISPQMLSWWSVSDDARLSSLMDVCEKMGLELKFSFKGEPKPIELTGKAFELNGFLPENLKRNNKVDPLLEGCSANCVRLKPLVKLIKDTRMTLFEFSQKIKSDYSNLCRWLKNDDLKISKLYNAAENTERKLVWTVNPIEED